MKFSIPVFVPTRGNRKYLERMCEQLAFCERVIFLASHVDTSNLPSNCIAMDMTHRTRQFKRQMAVLMAEADNLPYCLQVDDDLKADFATILPELVRLLDAYPRLGSVCSLNRVAANQGWHPQPVSHPFIVKNFPSQVVAMRIEAYRQTSGYRVYTSDDADIGGQLWDAGWVNAATWIGTHSETRPRGGSPKLGGLPSAEYEEHIHEDFAVMNKLHSLQSIKGRVDRNGRTRAVTRWDWKFIRAVVNENLGSYQDEQHTWSIL